MRCNLLPGGVRRQGALTSPRTYCSACCPESPSAHPPEEGFSHDEATLDRIMLRRADGRADGRTVAYALNVGTGRTRRLVSLEPERAGLTLVGPGINRLF
ncbi:hypothetical protein ACQEUU_09755 [Nonomuraea sp. CA-218870]|uniref:hypothetical protein n=1 Tax=Nonomuraea sp. CA-218870 TaxID=3239998 RepID=UPI003D8B1A1E